MSEKEEIRIHPKKTIEMIKLRMQGYSDYKIAKELKKSPISVTRTLARFEKEYSLLEKFCKDVKRTHYFVNKLRSQFGKRGVARRKQLLEFGIPLVGGIVPLGYKNVNGKYAVNEKNVPLARTVFETYYNGGNMEQLCRKIGISPTTIYDMIRNPLFIGEIIYKGEVYRFPHLAIIDKDLWKACQPREKKFPYKPPFKVFGFIRKAGRLYKDPETAAKIVQIFDLLLQGKSFREIEKTTDLKRGMVCEIVRKPVYANKVLVDGKYEDAGVEEIIPFETWLKAQAFLKEHPPRLLYKQAIERQQTEKRDKILTQIAVREPKGVTFKELKKIMFASSLCVYLRKLKEEGAIEKIGGYRGKFHVSERIKGSYPSSIKTPPNQREILEEIFLYRSAGNGKKLLEQLLRQPGTFSEICKGLGITDSATAKWLRKLESKGIVEKETKGFKKWRITDDWVKPVQEFLVS
jgi:hypothetical protein